MRGKIHSDRVNFFVKVKRINLKLFFLYNSREIPSKIYLIFYILNMDFTPKFNTKMFQVLLRDLAKHETFNTKQLWEEEN